MRAAARPPFAMDAIVGCEEAHVTDEVKSSVEPSEKVPVAVNCSSKPSGTEDASGVIAMDESTAFVTMRLADPEIEPEAAVIVAAPTARPLAKPLDVMLAMLAVAVQLTEALISCLEPSVKAPVAVNCCVFPAATEGAGGVTAIETKAAAVTVSVVEPLTEPEVAMMVDVPVAFVFTSPLALIVATEV